MSVIIAADSAYLSRSIVKTSFPQSWAAWVKFDADDPYQHYVMCVGNISEYDYYLYLLAKNDTSGGDFVRMGRIEGGAHNNTIDYRTVSTGAWNHIAATWGSSGEQLLYWNGVQLDDSITAAWGTNYNAFFIGHQGAAYGGSFRGKIAHAALWNTVQSSTDIGNLYNGGTGGGKNPLAVNNSDLLAYWPLYDDRFDDKGSYDLTENGTLTWSTADNPTVDAPPGGTPTPSMGRCMYILP